MDFIYVQNPNISIGEFIPKLEVFLEKLCFCSINGKLNVSSILFERELNVHINRDRTALAIRPKIFTQMRYRDRKENQNEVFKSVKKFIKKFDVNSDNLKTFEKMAIEMTEKLKEELRKIPRIPNAEINIKPPGKCDVSLPLLGIRIAHEEKHVSKVITDDSLLFYFIVNCLLLQEKFESVSGVTWKLGTLEYNDVINPIGCLYGCCELDQILELYNYWDRDLDERWLKLKRIISRAKKRIKDIIASNLDEQLRLKEKNRTGDIHV